MVNGLVGFLPDGQPVKMNGRS